MKPFVPRNFTPSDNSEHLRIQACALNRLCNATESILHNFRAKDYDLSEKRLAALEKSVESEREMNAILTKEVESLSRLKSDLLMLRQSNNQPGWKEAIDAVSNILP